MGDRLKREDAVSVYPCLLIGVGCIRRGRRGGTIVAVEDVCCADLTIAVFCKEFFEE